MTYTSSTVRVPDVAAVPRHIAIIMDGNGRWATQRRLPRVAGHTRGVDAVRAAVEACAKRGVEYLTLFAFSSENWRRPTDEVSFLMRLFVTALEREVGKLHANGIRLRVVGDLSMFDSRIQDLIRRAETRTARNTRLTLTIAANYGGRWDIMQATRKLVEEAARTGEPAPITEDSFAQHLAMAYAPEPDLFIRTGGEQRISNFLLWQLAYTEFYFTDTYWPDFDADALAHAISSYAERERRFGRTSAQLEPQSQDADSLSC
ncbi:polyprenyl diphosphate synthase [Paraburkholderia caballeronis]|uniref:Isoprenyl transferase n=1 Tax=Paraburkholderia caballeronis TaxID=416943 RepID=A0A1H7ND95_9BURK|nr:polyprenyl diphosphate synthase [Paraburkholderia caballeronis]PXW26159.1 undecaprenyl pyrophosphate synthetase [Paraburkholderia caballeronis]PXX01706.1 undecaprenyl pyrophosphate synthetase [Paraburkholderia caballeronis]RAK00863.1 undecaprenyl pyrophosphate synthetase [Paraburkholderia caballeronis]TDV20901.1 undecaprenyl pyrophosphate synthetase [Paraburkholderia caballeronis]TDV21330.1 undecaprenyl pyrophosphate synthetase [Paraburkholderia caballeronis]